MNALEKIVEGVIPKKFKMEKRYEYVDRYDLGVGVVEIRVYDYNKLTGDREYLHSVNLICLTEYKE